MFGRWKMALLTVVVVAGFGLVGQAISQEQPGGQGGQGGPGGDRGNRRDPARMMQMMAERIKTQLGVTDDEWKVLEPKVEKVATLAMQSRGGGLMMMMRGGRGGRGGQGPTSDNASQSDVQKKLADLQAVLENKDSKPDEVKAALTAYRDARTKARDELTKAQKELQELLTQRQEATLVMYGLLD